MPTGVLTSAVAGQCGPFQPVLPVPELVAQLGYSGCALRLVQQGTQVCVEKRASGPHAMRLQRQIVKQQAARRANASGMIRIPELYDQQWYPDGSYVARMEYLSFSSCMQFFASASRPQIDQTMAMLIAYINGNLAASTLQAVCPSRFTDKLDQIDSALVGCAQSNCYGPALRRVRQCLREPLLLPTGPAHGDLTLSNVMIAADASQIGLFDFLDGYLESPLVDIAKLRQDTRFHWSLCLAGAGVERARLEPILAYMDRFLLTHFKRHEWMRHLDLIEAINLLRIVPYAGAGAAAGADAGAGLTPRSQRVHQLLTRALAALGF